MRGKSSEELDPFEIIVGGLSWCIGYVRPEFNQDIMLTEGMSLGAKVGISEKIVMYLKE